MYFWFLGDFANFVHVGALLLEESAELRSAQLAPLDDDLSFLLDRPFALNAFVGTHNRKTTRLQKPSRQALLSN